LSIMSILLLGPAHHADLPSFPTRRSSDLAFGLRSFHLSTMRRSSLIGSALSSTCSRRIVSLCSHTPQSFLTMTSAADCCPRLSRSEEHTSELQSPYDLVCRLLLEKKKKYV